MCGCSGPPVLQRSPSFHLFLLKSLLIKLKLLDTARKKVMDDLHLFSLLESLFTNHGPITSSDVLGDIYEIKTQIHWFTPELKNAREYVVSTTTLVISHMPASMCYFSWQTPVLQLERPSIFPSSHSTVHSVKQSESEEARGERKTEGHVDGTVWCTVNSINVVLSETYSVVSVGLSANGRGAEAAGVNGSDQTWWHLTATHILGIWLNVLLQIDIQLTTD